MIKQGLDGSVITGSYDGFLSVWDKELFFIRYI